MFFINIIKYFNIRQDFMDIKNLNTFIHVAELGSFSKAGDRLGYSQPTISVQIRQLEQELGCRLFDRVGHMVRLTDKGQEVLLYAQQIAGLCQQMSQGAVDTAPKTSIIRLATADSLCSPLIGREFAALRSRHPNISLKLTTAGTGELFRLLDHNEVDLVCTLDNHIYNTNYIIAGEEKIGVHFVVSANHPLVGKSCLTKQDLITQDFLLTERGMSYRRLLDEWMARDSLQIQPVLETGSAALICKLVEGGLGMAFLPDYVTQAAVERGTLVRLEAEDFHPELWMQLLYHRGKWRSPALDAVIDHFTGVSLQTE